ncbi:adenylate/guanylate cyclase domain-containing protein [Armatimonas rosea]|uniref:Putative ATPase/class 3 adenylate cyclase/Tfp pilus assembly protein PilF n=1 Tax=Armatimonas rosea TaxID=685828 RepID=A0A7W9SMQ7_ARMRO|nr:adenylate/guanylate cyclase domain-containing protein [Armatimonas rosea]MBB6048688.1 putative ATPase/class 3 adenylate cyclase/Tfp pilus assembly protein PilF [Armatimonas rosea]
MSQPGDPPPFSSGTLTFLFTDIEGSTRLWEAFPQEMGAALARHDTLLRGIVQEGGGYLFKTVGDAFCVAFDDATRAVLTASKAQQVLGAEPWPESTPLKVRMALHTGAVESRDNDYFGPPLNRIARLLSTAHGGQTLLSQSTAQLVLGTLTGPESLRDLGIHQLKDLTSPEHVYQLEHPELTASFPPIKSLSTHLNNLPQQVTQFIGRERETVAVRELLQQTRLLTLTGAGGTGKTRLALQVAAELLERFPDGIWFVELAPLDTACQVVQALASTIGAKEQSDLPLELALTIALKEKQLLILLDNCEHLIDATAKLAETLVRQCAGVQILASSREALGVLGEQTYRVPSLSLPDRHRPQTPEALAQFEAVQLFLDRARLTRPDFQITAQNAKALASLCCRLDGIPLALELSAARLRSLSVEEIDAKLNQRFRLLTGGSRTALPRQQTLRALIDWSYDLLNDQEKALLHRLSVFSGGWTLPAAEAVCAGDAIEDWEVLDLLTSLVDKNLAVADQAEAHTRYRLSETVREYATEKLAAHPDDAQATSQRHAAFFLSLAQVQLQKLRDAEEAEALEALTKEGANLRVALEAAQTLGDSLLLGELALANGILHQRHGFLHEAVEAIELGLGAAVPAPLRAKLLLERAGLHADFNQPDGTRRCIHEALAISTRLQDALGVAHAQNLLGQAAMQERDYPDAHTQFLAALASFEAAGDQVGVAIVQNNLGVTLRRDRSGAPEDWEARATQAEQHLTEALRLRHALQDRRGLAETLNNLGVLAFERQEWEKANRYYREAVPHYESLRNTLGLGFMLANLGEVAESQRDFRKAVRLYLGSILLLEQVRSPLAQEIEAWLTRAATAGTLPSSELATLRREASLLSPEAQRGWALSEENSTAPLSHSS